MSIEFVYFLPVVFILYWLLFNLYSLKIRNLYLIAISFVFYGWWNWKVCLLLFTITLITYLCGYSMDQLAKKDRTN